MSKLNYSVVIAIILIVSCIVSAIIAIYNNDAKYYIINITPTSISYSGEYAYINYTTFIPFGQYYINYTIYGYKNLVYNLSIGANCSFMMFNETMFDWGRCN